MAFLCGPRQVGKTTAAKRLSGEERYLNWDAPETRSIVLKGAKGIACAFGLDDLDFDKRVVALDEFHKYGKWKALLKGFFDLYGDRCRCIVTGSARMDLYKRGGDSLAGRFFNYRMHPLSIGELCRTIIPGDSAIQPPLRLSPADFAALLRFGGFPEPFSRQDTRFYNRWRAARHDVILKEDIRDLTRVQETASVQLLAELLAAQTGQPVNQSNLAAMLQVSVDTIARWLRLLEALYVVFSVRPWFKCVAKSIRKQPKVYFRDWSVVAAEGARNENFIACHLLKAAQMWEDLGIGRFELGYLRDKTGREVDFVVIRDGKPWFLVEVKTGEQRELNRGLAYFQKATGARHAFQVAVNAAYRDADCFAENAPVRVPAATLLSQLV
ncbi:MAG: ATP-binding protein [Lentisphaerae bacterium]|nr:ATP-binding protein [Lentisphaerota bacterium]